MLKRPLFCLTILFFAGIIITVINTELSLAVLLCMAFLCGASIFFMRSEKVKKCMTAFLVILLGMTAMSIAQKERADIISRFSGRTTDCEMIITEFSEDGSVIASFKENKKNYRVYLTVKSDIQLYPGNIVSGEIRLRAPIDSKTQFSDFSKYLASRGVHLLASAETVKVTGKYTKGMMGKIYSLRRGMDSVGEKYFYGDGRALFNAMVFGDKRLISDNLSDALRASGLNHIAVVSGMHLSVIIAMQMLFIRKLFGKKRIGYFFSLAAAVFITLATGAGASVVRALVMCGVFLLSQILYRENDILTSLSFSALLMAAVNPYIIFNAGFVLSVLSVWGIITYNDKILSVFTRLMPRRAAEAASVSLSAQLGVTPALVIYFGMISPYALLSNILVVFISTVYVIAGIVFLAVSWIPVVSDVFAELIKLMSGAIESTCYTIMSFPGSLISYTSSIIGFVILWAFILLLIYLCPIDRKKLYPVTAVFIAAVLVLGMWKTDSPTIQYLPYGKSVMTLVVPDNGEAFIIDCPDIYDAKMVESPDKPFRFAVLSSADEMELFRQESDIKEVIAPKALFKEKEAQELLTLAKSMNIRILFADDFQKVSAGGSVVEYIPVSEKGGRIVKVLADGKTLISLQGLNGNEVESLFESGQKLRCDYMKLPYIPDSSRDYSLMCTGEIFK